MAFPTPPPPRKNPTIGVFGPREHPHLFVLPPSQDGLQRRDLAFQFSSCWGDFSVKVSNHQPDQYRDKGQFLGD